MRRAALVLLSLCLTAPAPALAGAPRRGGGPAPGEEEGAGAKPGVLVERSEDVVILTDGTKIVGTIVAAGERAVMIIEKGAKTERVIKRPEIESFRRGASERRTVAYKVEKDTYQGTLVLTESEGSDAAAPAPAPKPKPKPGPGKPKPKPVAGGDLKPLWRLLEGKSSADQIARTFARNPDWNRQVTALVRSGRVPPEGLAAVRKFKARLATDPAFRKALADLDRQGKLPPTVKGILGGRKKK